MIRHVSPRVAAHVPKYKTIITILICENYLYYTVINAMNTFYVGYLGTLDGPTIVLLKIDLL